jgi:hypothetical protein
MVLTYIVTSFTIAYHVIRASILVFLVGFTLYALFGDRSHFREKMKSSSPPTNITAVDVSHSQSKQEEKIIKESNPEDSSAVSSADTSSRVIPAASATATHKEDSSAAATAAIAAHDIQDLIPELADAMQEEETISRRPSVESTIRGSVPHTTTEGTAPDTTAASLQVTLPVEVISESMAEPSPERGPVSSSGISSADVAGKSISRLPRVASPRRSPYITNTGQRENVMSPEKHPASFAVDEAVAIPPTTPRAGSNPRSQQQGLKPTEIVLQSRQNYASPLRGRSMNASISPEGVVSRQTPNPVAKRLITPTRERPPQPQPSPPASSSTTSPSNPPSAAHIDILDLIGKEVLIQGKQDAEEVQEASKPAPGIAMDTAALESEDREADPSSSATLSTPKKKIKSPKKKAKATSSPSPALAPPSEEAKQKERERQVEEARAAAKARILQKAKDKARMEAEYLERQRHLERVEQELVLQAKEADQRRAEQGRYEAIMRLKAKSSSSSSSISSSPSTSQLNSPKLSRSGSRTSSPRSSQKTSPKATRATSPRSSSLTNSPMSSSLSNTPRSSSPMMNEEEVHAHAHVLSPDDENVIISLSPRTERHLDELIAADEQEMEDHAHAPPQPQHDLLASAPSNPLIAMTSAPACVPLGEEVVQTKEESGVGSLGLNLQRPSSLLAAAIALAAEDSQSSASELHKIVAHVSSSSSSQSQSTIPAATSTRPSTPMKVRFKEALEDVKIFERDYASDEELSEEELELEAEAAVAEAIVHDAISSCNGSMNTKEQEVLLDERASDESAMDTVAEEMTSLSDVDDSSTVDDLI